MNSLSKEKKQQLILVVVITSVILSGLGFGLVSAQQKSRADHEKRIKDTRQKIEFALKILARKDEINKSLEVKKPNCKQHFAFEQTYQPEKQESATP